MQIRIGWGASRGALALRLAIGALIFCLLGSTAALGQLIPERRKDQFPDEPAYLVVPLPYEYPGIGSGWLLLGNVQNIAGTHADVFAIWATGDAEGQAIVLDDVHLISKTLLLSYTYQSFDKLVIQNYETRGMDTDKDDFNFIEINDNIGWEAEATLTFFDRRFDIFAGHQENRFEVPRLRDSDGNIIVEADPPFEGESQSDFAGIRFDFTDDRQDPRKGIRFRVRRDVSPRTNRDQADFFRMNYDTLLYLPVGAISTFVLNYFRSDAVVTDKGNTNEADIRAELGFNCSAGDAECLQAEQEIVDLFVAERTYGNSSGLGGIERLRSYPGNRFNGGHTEFYGAEFRWNLTEEFTPFDYFVWKDTRTGLQIAFFYEVGSVAEKRSDLWKRSRESYGAGVRMVTGSGSVYRFDVATGDEGAETTIFFFYPWN